jgi:hypothetical protein
MILASAATSVFVNAAGKRWWNALMTYTGCIRSSARATPCTPTHLDRAPNVLLRLTAPNAFDGRARELVDILLKRQALDVA